MKKRPNVHADSESGIIYIKKQKDWYPSQNMFPSSHTVERLEQELNVTRYILDKLLRKEKPPKFYVGQAVRIPTVLTVGSLEVPEWPFVDHCLVQEQKFDHDNWAWRYKCVGKSKQTHWFEEHKMRAV